MSKWTLGVLGALCVLAMLSISVHADTVALGELESAPVGDPEDGFSWKQAWQEIYKIDLPGQAGPFNAIGLQLVNPNNDPGLQAFEHIAIRNIKLNGKLTTWNVSDDADPQVYGKSASHVYMSGPAITKTTDKLTFDIYFQEPAFKNGTSGAKYPKHTVFDLFAYYEAENGDVTVKEAARWAYSNGAWSWSYTPVDQITPHNTIMVEAGVPLPAATWTGMTLLGGLVVSRVRRHLQA